MKYKTVITTCLIIAIIGWSLILSGCALSDIRKEGFNTYQAHFTAINDEGETFHKVIKIDKVEVHIVTDRSQFEWEKASNPRSCIVAYADTDNKIWLLEKKVDGKIVVNQAILGHEFNHLLNFTDGTVADPNRLDELGL